MLDYWKVQLLSWGSVALLPQEFWKSYLLKWPFALQHPRLHYLQSSSYFLSYAKDPLWGLGQSHMDEGESSAGNWKSAYLWWAEGSLRCFRCESHGADLDPDNNTIHQHRTLLLKPSLTVETSRWTSSSVASEYLHLSSRPPEDLQGFPNGMQHLKRGALDHWATIQPYLPSAQVRHFNPYLQLTAGLW